MIRSGYKMTVASCCDKNVESSPEMGVKQGSRSDLYSGFAAFEHVRDNIDGLNGTPGIEDNDLIFLKALMESPAMRGIVKVQDRLTTAPHLPAPITTSSASILSELLQATTINSPGVAVPAPGGNNSNTVSSELRQLLSKPHVQQLIRTHDEIGKLRGKQEDGSKARKDTDQTTPSAPPEMYTDLIRMVGLRKTLGEPLGLTVHQEDNGQLVVARILGSGTVDRQGLLHPGDVILEVNGEGVITPEDLQQEISKAKDTVTLKVAAAAPARVKHQGGETAAGKKLTCYMRALYDYNPATDTLLPCREIGLEFHSGDVLQIVDQRDPNWWQARIVATNTNNSLKNNENNSMPAPQDGQVGLIPSLELEERRKAFVAPEADYVHKIGMCGARISKKKRRFLYKSKSNNDFDKDELLLYEEVTRMPPFKRKTLVLIGSQGVGRRTLKNRLVNSDPEKFGSVIPHTSRPQRVLEEDGKSYWFCDRPAMEEEIREHRYLEYGNHNGHIYGTHLDSIRDVIRRGRMCVLDCGPGSLKTLHNSAEFLPYVVFIAAPGMELLKQMYNQPGGSRGNLQFDRQSSIRYSSRRARTLESLASLYEEDDLRNTVEESARLQRAYEKYVDLVLINEDFDMTFRRLVQALDALATEHQWVPVNWIY